MNSDQENEINLEAAWDKLPEHLKGDLIMQVMKELSIVSKHTRLLVLVSHGFIELLINALVDHYIKNRKIVTSDSRSYPHATKLLLLNELNIISDDQYKILDWFRKLRNKAAHVPIFDVTKQDLSMMPQEKYREPSNFYELCIILIGSLWNEHIPIFGPKYSPGAYGDNKAQ